MFLVLHVDQHGVRFLAEAAGHEDRSLVDGHDAVILWNEIVKIRMRFRLNPSQKPLGIMKFLFVFVKSIKKVYLM